MPTEEGLPALDFFVRIELERPDTDAGVPPPSDRPIPWKGTGEVVVHSRRDIRLGHVIGVAAVSVKQHDERLARLAVRHRHLLGERILFGVAPRDFHVGVSHRYRSALA